MYFYLIYFYFVGIKKIHHDWNMSCVKLVLHKGFLGLLLLYYEAQFYFISVIRKASWKFIRAVYSVASSISMDIYILSQLIKEMNLIVELRTWCLYWAAGEVWIAQGAATCWVFLSLLVACPVPWEQTRMGAHVPWQPQQPEALQQSEFCRLLSSL